MKTTYEVAIRSVSRFCFRSHIHIVVIHNQLTSNTSLLLLGRVTEYSIWQIRRREEENKTDERQSQYKAEEKREEEEYERQSQDKDDKKKEEEKEETPFVP